MLIRTEIEILPNNTIISRLFQNFHKFYTYNHTYNYMYIYVYLYVSSYYNCDLKVYVEHLNRRSIISEQFEH